MPIYRPRRVTDKTANIDNAVSCRRAGNALEFNVAKVIYILRWADVIITIYTSDKCSFTIRVRYVDISMVYDIV